MTWIQDQFGQSPEEFFAERRHRVYTPNALLDDRFTWEEIAPASLSTLPDAIGEQLVEVDIVQEGQDPARWADMTRYRLTGCAHRVVEQGACLFCGAADQS